MSTINHDNEDVVQVAAALADAAHAGGLSDAYYRKADDALARLAARIVGLEGLFVKVVEVSLHHGFTEVQDILLDAEPELYRSVG